ncbi:fliP family protein (plasmid) [Yersinia pestis 1045]|nr:fliP family protein [Yersinia pestis 1045]
MIQLPDEINLIIVLSLLTLLPLISVMATSFVKFAVVFSLLRNALGVQQIPPNMAMYGLAIILSLYVMAPVGFATQDYLQANEVSLTNIESVEKFFDEGLAPYRMFLKQHIQAQEYSFLLTALNSYGPSSMLTG